MLLQAFEFVPQLSSRKAMPAPHSAAGDRVGSGSDEGRPRSSVSPLGPLGPAACSASRRKEEPGSLSAGHLTRVPPRRHRPEQLGSGGHLCPKQQKQVPCALAGSGEVGLWGQAADQARKMLPRPAPDCRPQEGSGSLPSVCQPQAAWPQAKVRRGWDQESQRVGAPRRAKGQSGAPEVGYGTSVPLD